MKQTLLLVILALALPVFAQASTCNHKPIFLPVQPTAGSYSCTAKDGTAWTLAFQDTEGGMLEVTADGPGGSFTWQQSVQWSKRAFYAACAGDVCWKFTQHLIYAGGNGLDFKGRFVVGD